MSDRVEIPAELWRSVVELCFTQMPSFYRGGADAVVEWRLRGVASGRWQLVLEPHRCEVHRDGTHPPDVCLEATDLDFVAICIGRANPRRLALQRRIRPRGNLLLAARLPRWFAQPLPPR